MHKHNLLAFVLFSIITVTAVTQTLTGEWTVVDFLEYETDAVYTNRNYIRAVPADNEQPRKLASIRFEDNGDATFAFENESEIAAFFTQNENYIYLQPKGFRDTNLYYSVLEDERLILLYNWKTQDGKYFDIIAILSRQK